MTPESRRKEARWGSIALGWLVAVLAGVMISPILRALFDLRAEPTGERGEFTAAVIAFLISGFLVYLVGGYVAARLAGYPWGVQRRHDGRFRDGLRDDAGRPRGDLCFRGSPPPDNRWLRRERRGSQPGSLPRQPARRLRRRDTREIVCPR